MVSKRKEAAIAGILNEACNYYRKLVPAKPLYKSRDCALSC
jgi:hypothetical protein